ncbi:pyridoxal 5'-phosphate synthase glutaminase subunit PdxT [Halonatronum saccharophilum]|uniref:pyridoxal 5'-phosphate synthase glutaminase subunit PdxT n=1 Tax=Halonatronum saccharophilum TaxID=150060 RepID=UPI0004838DD6|nr:pyridoxal 5'-phosphate synthase glutaminase subunit PdxT [Halonatronum saccharophilum]
MSKIGVLSLQGGVEEHLELLSQIEGVEPLAVKKKDDILKVDGLILPGGESTTIGKLLDIFDLKDTIVSRANAGIPLWGTCAGMILLAKEIDGEKSHLNLMDIKVRRNGYGNQLDSFKREVSIPKVSNKAIPLVFIRAPFVEEVGPSTEILLKLDGKIVGVEEENLLATSFHPELENDLSFHKYFVNKVKKSSYSNLKIAK